MLQQRLQLQQRPNQYGLARHANRRSVRLLAPLARASPSTKVATVSSSSSSSSGDAFLNAGPRSPAPDYARTEAQPLNALVMGLFRRKMVIAVGQDVDEAGYSGIIALTRKLNTTSPRETQVRTVKILLSLFPKWIPGSFRTLFARPFPELSCKMNALATALTCQWLMGPCTINDVETDDGKGSGKGQGVLVERCRYLEQSGCASICINSCKVPTQEFFSEHMGLPLTMTPNYEDFSCQFAFGKTPLDQQDDAAFHTPCFLQCPTKRRGAAQDSNCPKVKPSDDDRTLEC